MQAEKIPHLRRKSHEVRKNAEEEMVRTIVQVRISASPASPQEVRTKSAGVSPLRGVERPLTRPRYPRYAEAARDEVRNSRPGRGAAPCHHRG